jgi:membrane protease YdiL (CAAX protease family)
MVYLGLFQKQLSKKLSPYKAIVVAAVVFALLHFNLEKILITFTTGLLYGYLYYKTGKLIYPVLCHSLNNLLSTFLVYTPQDINVESVVTLLVVVVCFAVSLQYVLRYRVREAELCAAAEKESALDEAKLQEKSKQI